MDFVYFSELVSGWQSCFGDETETLAGLVPPAQLAEAHIDLVASRNEYLDEWRAFIEELDSFEEIAAMSGAVEGTASAAALAKVVSASCTIKEILDSEGINSTLRCPGDQPE